MLRTNFLVYKIFICLLLVSYRTSVAQTPNDTFSIFLKPTEYIDSDNKEIVKKALELTKDCKLVSEKAKVIFEFVRDSYSNSQFDSYKASDILRLGGNLCYQRSILLAALCRAVNIPSRLHVQLVTLKNYKYESGKIEDFVFVHGITGIFISDKWNLYESVGNNEKWFVWIQNRDLSSDFTVKFSPDRDCLFRQTDKVKIVTLPIYFHDNTTFLVELREKVVNGEIGFF